MKYPKHIKNNIIKNKDKWKVKVEPGKFNPLSLEDLNDKCWLSEWDNAGGYNTAVALTGIWDDEFAKEKGAVLPREWNAEERDVVHGTWSGALVRFIPTAPHFGGDPWKWVPGYENFQYPKHHKESRAGGKLPEDLIHTAGTGTIISVDDNPNYKGQWMVDVLWSDGIMSYENINDLVIVAPGSSGVQ